MSISYQENKKISHHTKHSKNQVVSLQVRMIPKKVKKSCKKWMSLSASLTIEAVFSLLLFLFASLSLIYPIQIMGLQGQIGQALEIVGDELTQAAYLAQDFDTNPHVLSMMSTLYAKTRVISILNQKQIDMSMIDNREEGLSFLESSVMQDGKTVDLVVRYKITMPFPLLSLNQFTFVQRSRRQGWVGEEKREDIEEELQVYVTDHGTVYHESLSCRHLKVHIQSINEEQLSALRNESGGIYYPCEVCKPDKGNYSSLFITKYGNRYHAFTSCRELAIGINSISISKAGEKTPCKSCYGS